MKKPVIITIRILAIIVLVISLLFLGKYVSEDIKDFLVQREIDKLKNQGDDVRTTEETHEILEEYKPLYKENKDVIGWLKINDTRIDYVVMYAPDTVEKYLRADFYGNYSTRGCLYVDEDCDILHSDNLIIYGHHMRDGTMFGTLMDYETKAFYLNHKYIQFDTIYEKHTYEVVAAIKTSTRPYGEKGFLYHQYTGVNDTEMFSQYMDFIENNKLYDTGVEVNEGDRLITLSTCAYHTDNGRFIVVAKQIA